MKERFWAEVRRGAQDTLLFPVVFSPVYTRNPGRKLNVRRLDPRSRRPVACHLSPLSPGPSWTRELVYCTIGVLLEDGVSGTQKGGVPSPGRDEVRPRGKNARPGVSMHAELLGRRGWSDRKSWPHTVRHPSKGHCASHW